MSAYYNEHDPKTAAWLRELIRAGHIADGEVDERSIVDVIPGDVRGFTQCHWFGGIGGWSAALRLARWSDERPVWTASLPCQPFSAAGQQKGAGDDRHLWPVFFALVRECRPQRIFGEQVAKAIGFNWLDGISADLEAEGYAVGSIVLGAHSVGAPHIRRRLYWVANADLSECDGRTRSGEQSLRDQGSRFDDRIGEPISAGLEGLAGNGDNWHEPGRLGADALRPITETGTTGRMCNAKGGGRGERRHEAQPGNSGHAERAGGAGLGGMADASGLLGAQQLHESRKGPWGATGPLDASERTGPYGPGPWSDFRVIQCRDGKARRVPTEPAFFPLADGLQPGRVGILRGAGNAIVPACAAAFIEACEEAIASSVMQYRNDHYPHHEAPPTRPPAAREAEA